MNMRKWQKIWFWASFWPIWPKFGPLKLFFKNLAPSVTRCHGQLSSCKISKKTIDPVLTDGQTGRGTRAISQDAVRLTSSVQQEDRIVSTLFMAQDKPPKKVYLQSSAQIFGFNEDHLITVLITHLLQLRCSVCFWSANFVIKNSFRNLL